MDKHDLIASPNCITGHSAWLQVKEINVDILNTMNVLTYETTMTGSSYRHNRRFTVIGSTLLGLVAIAIVLTVVFTTRHSHTTNASKSTSRPSTVAYTKPRTWYVSIGTQRHNTIDNRNVTLTGLSFYPSIITIDVGDTITWTVNTTGPQTIRFSNGDPPPPPSSAIAESAAGGHTCCAIGIQVSSGLLVAHDTYSLTFTTTGVYDYISDTTEGMQGVVVVQQKGSSYPESQNYLNKLANREELADIAVARQIQRSHIDEIKSPQQRASNLKQLSIHTPTNARIVLSSTGGSGAEGIAKINASTESINASADIYRLQPTTKYIMAIERGICTMTSEASTVSESQPIAASSSGYAHLHINTTITNQPGIPEAGWFIAIENASNNSIVACGNISYHNAEVTY